MSMAIAKPRIPTSARPRSDIFVDYSLLAPVLALALLGLIMVCSASITIADRELSSPFYYLYRQALYIGIGVAAAIGAAMISLEHWERFSPMLLLVGILMLLLVLVIGREVNGSQRWLMLGPVNLQPSELVKLFVILYISGYLVRRGAEVRSTMKGFLKPMGVLALIGLLLLLEPDFGATAVMTATALTLMFLAGVPLKRFAALIGMVLLAFVVLMLAAPYRVQRLTVFLDPWADPFNSGFQLTQALIAFGRGEWFGVGLGSSIQKLFYLPEAHTDFLFAVLAEELGLIGAIAVILLFGWIIWRAFTIGRLAAEKGMHFASFLAFGLGTWIALQAFINIGVNMGVLPTKGLTLPLMSYGGSSIVVMAVAVGLLLRIYHDVGVRDGLEPRRRARA
ncbi:MAG: putative lipid II flippase FtsW [Pseudomonadota bacterium]